MHTAKGFPDVIKSLMEGDGYANAILALTPDDLRRRINNDGDLVDIIKYMVDQSTPEELAILYLRTIQERDLTGEVFNGVLDKLLEDLDKKGGNTTDAD